MTTALTDLGHSLILDALKNETAESHVMQEFLVALFDAYTHRETEPELLASCMRLVDDLLEAQMEGDTPVSQTLEEAGIDLDEVSS